MYSVLRSMYVVLLLWQCIPKVEAQCSPNTEIGTPDPGKSSIKSVDEETGLGLLLNSDDEVSNAISYAATCCGFIKRWTFKPINQGTIVFQVWRPTTAAESYSLTGSNSYSVSGAQLNTLVTYDVDPDYRINISPTDIIGLYTPSKAIIAYKNLGGNTPRVAYTKSTTIGSKSDGDTFDWTTGTKYFDRREYALKYTLDPGTSVAPVFTNAEWTLRIADNTPISTTLYTVTVTENAVVTMTSATTLVTFNSETRTLVSAAPLLPGEYTFDFELSSDCGHTDTRTLSIVVNNFMPVLSVAPVTTSVREDHSSETVLYYATVGDQSLPGDTLSCSLSSRPITDNFLFSNRGSGMYAISIRDSPVLKFRDVSEYVLSMSCSDQKDSVTKSFGLHVTENKAPDVTNLPASNECHVSDYATGDVIYVVSASDPENEPVTFSMECATETCYFSINHDSGEIITVVDLSSLDDSSVNLMISVSDGFNTVGPLQLSVTITGLNDPPVITNLPTDGPVTVMENSALSSSVYQITVSDSNPGDTHTYTTTFDPESGESLFSIDPTNGLISTSSSTILDFEALSVHTFVMSVTVTDGNGIDVKELQIEVTNQNEPPEFQYETYSISGNEGESGTVLEIPDYRVSDPDSGSVVSFFMDCPPFKIDPDTGSISLSIAYDVDEPGARSSFTCSVMVSDGQLSDTSSLHITINNINDNSPTFFTSTYEFSTVADVALNTVVGSVTATDGDFGELGTFTYLLDQTSLDSEYFGVNEDGGVFVRDSLLTFTSGSYFTVSAKDTGNATGSATVSITILNSPPTITNLPLRSSLPVSENLGLSVSVFQVLVEDVNSEDTHTYTVAFTPEISSHLFNIDTSGVISTSSSVVIDYESLSVHSIVLSVTVSDGNALDVKELHIEVTNQNEPPEFQYETYSISGNEGEAGTMFDFPNYGVTDPDSGSTFSFSLDCPPFMIDPNIGSISLGTAHDVDDPEASSSFTCVLMVSDGQLSDTSSLHITINNINDNSPTFSTSTYEFSTVADVALNTVVGYVTATDGDVGEFGTFTYYLDQTLQDSEYFGIDEHGGVFVKESLLTFTSGSFLTVTAKDVGDSTGTANIVVMILNSPPIITNLPLQSSLTVSENSGLSVSIFQVLVEDVNSGDTHTYSATSIPAMATSLFGIDTSNGLISTSPSAMIDYESLPVHTIVMSVTVADGNALDVKELHIEVINQNEPPEFRHNSYSIIGNEGGAGTVVGRPMYGVVDPDGDSGLSFSMDCPPFSIESNTGSISLSITHDVDNPEATTSFVCDVMVSDGQLTDTASLLITINNINDNSPTFSTSTYEFSAFADVALETVIGSVTAVDGDVDDFGTFTYQLNQTQLGSEYFKIDGDGRILVKDSLLTFPSGSSFTITAKDTGNLMDSATVTVMVLNSAPVISNLPLASALQVSENSGLSVSIFRVLVEDVNSGDVHTYSATFTLDIASALLDIDSKSGVISTSVINRIDFESLSVKTFVMSVTVSDGKSEDTEHLVIEIIDVNEAPQFGRDMYHVYGNEGKVGDIFGRVIFDVSDPDTMSNPTLQVTSSCQSFEIDPETNEITLREDYDVDVQGTPLSVTCEVTVSDGYLSDTASLVLHVNNINDNSPVFINSSYSFYVKVNSSIGTFLGSVSAVDNDLGEFGLLKYNLTGHYEIVKYFAISDDGELTVKDLLPIRFSAKLLELSVVVYDVEGKSDKASIFVLVKPPSSDLPRGPDRYRTFLEDSRNIVWLATVSGALALCSVLVGYIIIRHVILPRTVPKSNKIDKWVEPRKRGSKLALVPSISSKSLWEPWHVKDF